MKVVINKCYGGFSLSLQAIQDLKLDDYSSWNVDRTNPELINLIETKGSKYVSGECAKLSIINVAEKYYQINDYDGLESIVASDSPILYYY